TGIASIAVALIEFMLAPFPNIRPGTMRAVEEHTRFSLENHIRAQRGRALPPWPLGAARRAVRRGQRCRRSRIQGDRGASAQRRRTQEGSATRPEAWERKPTAEAVLRRLRRRAPTSLVVQKILTLR